MYRDELAKEEAQLGSIQSITKRQRLENLRVNLERHLQKVKDAIKALDDNPNVEDVINKIDSAL